MNSPSESNDYELSKQSEQPYKAAEVAIPIKPDLTDAKREIREFFEDINSRLEDTKKRMGDMTGSPSRQGGEQEQFRSQQQSQRDETEDRARDFDPILLVLAQMATDLRDMKNSVEQLVGISQSQQNQ
jgi:hypothetical protein